MIIDAITVVSGGVALGVLLWVCVRVLQRRGWRVTVKRLRE